MEILFGLLSALFFGCADFCARFATRSIGTYRTLFYLQCVGFIVLSFYLLLSGSLFAPGNVPGWQPWFWGVLAGCVNTLSYLALYRAFATGKLAVVAPIASSYAAITVLLSLIAGERLSLLQLLGILAILAGVVLAALGGEAEGGQQEKKATGVPLLPARLRELVPAGVDWALLAAIGLGLTFWLLGFTVTPVLGQIVPVWLFRLSGIAILAPLAACKRQSLSLPRGSNLALVISIGLLDTGAFVASALGFASGNVAIVSVLTSLYSAVAVLLAAIFLRERLRAVQWTGIGILLIGVVLTHL